MSSASDPTPPTGTTRLHRLALAAAASAASVAAGLTVAGNLRQVARVRREAPDHLVVLDHAGVFGEGTGEPIRLLILGDSAADGYGIADAGAAFPQQVARRLAQACGRRVVVRSLATSGHCTPQLITEQVPRIAEVPPDVIVISVGVNDAIGPRSAGQVRDDTAALLDAVRGHAPKAALVLVGCPDISSAPGLPRPLDRIVGWRCHRVAGAQRAVAEGAGVAFADLMTLTPPGPEMYGPDGFHPGPPAQAAMADATLTALLPATSPEPDSSVRLA